MMRQDAEYLRLLSIFHYVVGGVAALMSLFPVIHLAIGLLIVVGAAGAQGDQPPAFIGWFFMLIAGVMIVLGLAFAICVMIAGRFLAQRAHYMYCLVMACIECVFMPFGTVLGVLTILVLVKDSVKAVFQDRGLAASPR